MKLASPLPLTNYNVAVEKTVRVFRSFDDADTADALDDASLSAEQRLRILFELRDLRHPDAAEPDVEQGLASLSSY
jgi:hypothetical protein